jgi:hypothetical protein
MGKGIVAVSNSLLRKFMDDFVPPWVCVGCSYIHDASAPKRYLRFGEVRVILCTSCYLGLAYRAELLRKHLEEAVPKLPPKK